MSLDVFLKLQILLLQLCSLTFGMLYFFDDSDDELLKQNNLIAKFTSWGIRYYVIFKLKPLSYSRGWENVIHFTVGGDNSGNGDRIPGFWFTPYDSGILSIDFSANGNQQSFLSPPLLLNSWSTIQICQDIVDGNYLTSAYINGKLVQSIVNNLPQTFKNVLVYAADPWYVANNGYIKDLKVSTGNSNIIEDLKEHAMIKDNLVATLPSLEKTYSVSFKVKPTLYNTINYTSVIHLTNGGDWGYYGCRNPGVWLETNGRMKIYSSVNGKYDYYTITERLHLNKWTSIRISQFQLNKIYTYTIYLNGYLIHSTENTQPEAFTNVNVYSTNPWHYAQDGFIKDLRIINGNEETCDLKTMLSSSIQNEEIHIRIKLTTNCECYLQNVTLHLQPDKLLIFKRFSWDDSSLNDSFVETDGKFIFVDVPKLSKDSPAWFLAIFVYVKNLNGRTNGSLEGHSKWSYCYGDPVFKVNQLNFNMPIKERFITPVVKMNPISSYNQLNQTILQTETYQFVCTNMQKRQPSPCYQREISTGIITFYSIRLLNIIGYNSSNQVIYGRTHRGNVIEMNLNKRKPYIITKERCSKIKACQSFISEN